MSMKILLSRNKASVEQNILIREDWIKNEFKKINNDNSFMIEEFGVVPVKYHYFTSTTPYSSII